MNYQKWRNPFPSYPMINQWSNAPIRRLIPMANSHQLRFMLQLIPPLTKPKTSPMDIFMNQWIVIQLLWIVIQLHFWMSMMINCSQWLWKMNLKPSCNQWFSMSMIINSYQRFWSKSKTLPLRHFWLVVTGTWLEHDFPFSWECHHPNWPRVFRWVGRKATNQLSNYQIVGSWQRDAHHASCWFFLHGVPWNLPLLWLNPTFSRCDSNFLGLSLW